MDRRSISVDEKDIIVTITEDRIKDSVALLKDLKRAKAISLKTLQKVAGRMVFIASLVSHLTPFLSKFWGAIAELKDQQSSFTRRGGQLEKDCTWLLAFLGRIEGSLVRSFLLGRSSKDAFRISTDASPWSIGGV